MIKIKNCKFGRGIFATESIPKNTIIEISPLIVIPKRQVKYIEKTDLQLYVYDFDKGKVALALGLGSLFNHKNSPNVGYTTSRQRKSIAYWTLKDIRKGSQLFINYGYSIREANKWRASLKS